MIGIHSIAGCSIAIERAGWDIAIIEVSNSPDELHGTIAIFLDCGGGARCPVGLGHIRGGDRRPGVGEFKITIPHRGRTHHGVERTVILPVALRGDELRGVVGNHALVLQHVSDHVRRDLARIGRRGVLPHACAVLCQPARVKAIELVQCCRVGVRVGLILNVCRHKTNKETAKYRVGDGHFRQVGKEDSTGVVPNIDLTFPALCELGGILEGRLIDDIGHAGYLNCQSHNSPASHWPAVPAHVCACPLHDLVGHTRAV